MLNYRSKSWGFIPRYGPPKNSTDPELAMRHHQLSAGAVWGDMHCHLIHYTGASYFIS